MNIQLATLTKEELSRYQRVVRQTARRLLKKTRWKGYKIDFLPPLIYADYMHRARLRVRLLPGSRRNNQHRGLR